VIAPGSTVEASSGEAVELSSSDGVTVILEPGTLARWLTPGKLPSETNHFVRGHHLGLIEGELDVRMPPGPKGAHAFLVSTRAGTLTDWRGKLHILSHEETTTAAIYEGALVVGSNGQGFPVYDGAGILMHKGINPDKSRSIPGAPKWATSGQGLSPFVAMAAGTRATVGFAWDPVPGATRYRVAIASDPDMVNVFQRATTAETTYGLLESQATKPYWAQVRAVGAEGIVGEWSTARPLRVVRYELPTGAFVSREGTVVLPPGLTLNLEDAEGVEVAYENVRSLSARIPGIPLYWARQRAAPPHRLFPDADRPPARSVARQRDRARPRAPAAPGRRRSFAERGADRGPDRRAGDGLGSLRPGRSDGGERDGRDAGGRRSDRRPLGAHRQRLGGAHPRAADGGTLGRPRRRQG